MVEGLRRPSVPVVGLDADKGPWIHETLYDMEPDLANLRVVGSTESRVHSRNIHLLALPGAASTAFIMLCILAVLSLP